VSLLLVAVFLAGFAALELAGSNRCADDSALVFRLALDPAQPVGEGFADTFIADCRGARRLAIAANVLAERRRLSEAVRLSDEAIRREPRNYEGWLALSGALRRRGLDAAARRALAHVRALNPRYGHPLG